MNNYGHRKDGTPVTDADVEVMADEAERGYDVETLLRRRPGGRPPLGTAAASVESVRLDPELKRALLIRVAEEHVSVSEVIGEYLRAFSPSPWRGRTSQSQPARTGGVVCRWLGQGCRIWTYSGCAAGAPSASPSTCAIRSGWNAMPGPGT